MASDRETLLGRIRPVMIWAVGESAPLAVCGRCGSVLMDDVEHANRREHEEWHAAIEAPSSSAAPNQTAAEPATPSSAKINQNLELPLADSELRDRIAEVARDASGTTEGSQQYAPIHWDDVAAEIFDEAVAPVLAERDGQIAELKTVLKEECVRLTAAWTAARNANMTALETIAALKAEVDLLRRNADRDARIVDGLRGERITLWEERDKAATALAAIKDWKWERPPTLLDRIELVASELDIARRERDALKADQGIRAGALADVLGVGRNRSVEGYYALVERVARIRAELDQWRTGPVVVVDRNDLASGVGSQPDSLDERTIERITYTDHDGVEKVWDDKACSWVVDQRGGDQ